MKLLVTADLHFNHGKSHTLAVDLINRINQTSFDALLIVGDTAQADDNQLEQALSSIRFTGPKLFICGNHELWTRRDDSYAIFTTELPKRIRDLGWHWIEEEPFVIGDLAVVGTIGWYDYSYAPDSLQIPHRFYQAKVSPGAAAYLAEYHDLISDDVSPAAKEIVARWNDGKFVKLHRSDVDFLNERITGLQKSLATVPQGCRIVAGVHHVPFSQLLPPRHNPAWDFARAYLGSDQLGITLLDDPRITHLFCGHSHFAAESKINHIHAINIGSGYRQKLFWLGEV